MKIIINGATGQIGKHLLNRLDLKSNEYVLITRRAESLADLAAEGATIAEGDLEDKQFLERTLNGGDVYFFLPPPDFSSPDMVAAYERLAQASREAALANGIKRIVHLSTLGAHIDNRETGLIYGQHLAENIIAEAAPNVLHLRNGFFLENYFASAQTIKQDHAIYLPVHGEARYRFVSTEDIAALVDEYLHDTSWQGNQVIEFQGPAEYSFAEVAQQFATALNREVSHVGVPPEAAIEALQGMGMSAAYARDLTVLLQAIGSGLLVAEFAPGDDRVREHGLTPQAFASRYLSAVLN